MSRRFIFLPLVVVLALMLGFSAVPAAEEDDPQTHEGIVVRAGNGELVMSDDQQAEHKHKVGADVPIFLDGKEAKLEDLRAGFKVKVMTAKKGAENTVTKIEATS